MDANQEELSNPFGMDEECRNCPELCETRSTIAHGYGDVGGEFLFLAERPHEGADETGIPFTGDEHGRRLQSILGELSFVRSEPDAAEPDIQNAYCTYLTRCRDPERSPTKQ
ncbi:MAG TPA: uracil-DNA glycosylase family protein, partial [Natronoarchaeum rubrum]|nr:uracil-DNA glycosylase family protein [Natronoarchaeum rubrum]